MFTREPKVLITRARFWWRRPSTQKGFGSVVSLLPGRILTDRNLELLDTPAARAAAAAAIPLRRLGGPEEFGRVAAFLLSPAASYLTGVAVPIDGGIISAF